MGEDKGCLLSVWCDDDVMMMTLVINKHVNTLLSGWNPKWLLNSAHQSLVNSFTLFTSNRIVVSHPSFLPSSDLEVGESSPIVVLACSLGT